MKYTTTYTILIKAKLRAKVAGQNHQLVPCCVSAVHTENAAPVMGPVMKPTAKATPIKAIALVLVDASVTSAMIAVDRLTLALLMPPKALARTNRVKLSAIAQRR